MVANSVKQHWAERFWLQVHMIPGGCWLWTGRGEKDGYGRFGDGANTRGEIRAHRISWILAHGTAIPDNLHVLHVCDVRNCVNPSHLWLGTNEDNTQDRHIKGRSAAGRRNGSARLTQDVVDYIMAKYKTGRYTFKRLAADTGFSKSTVENVVHGRSFVQRGVGKGTAQKIVEEVSREGA